VKDNGIFKALKRAARSASRQGKRDVRDDYWFALAEPVGRSPTPGSLDPRTVNWVVPPFVKGSGGHLNAFRFVRMLEDRGFRCCIVVQAGPWLGTPESVRESIREWFFPIDGEVVLGIENAPPAHISIATAFMTAYDLHRFRSTLHRCYFVQDFEPMFAPAGSMAAFAEATYRFGFVGITAGTWLARKLADEYGMKTHAVGFSCDRAIYRPTPRRDPRRRVLFYGRPSSERRAFELGLLSLERVVARHPEVEVVFVGGGLDEYVIPFPHRVEGVLDAEELALLYNECDVAMVLSMTNVSLLPLELMACGVPVVSNRAPCTEWLLNDRIAQLADATIDDLCGAVCEVLENADRRAQLRAAGLAAAAGTSWEAEGDKLAAILSSLT
jgi:glycosyltransferase involved in cell wall biosynthesis